MADITPADARAAIIATVLAVPGIRAALPRLPETIPVSPCAVIGPHTATYAAGQSRQRVRMLFPLRVYVERTSDDDRTMAAAEALIRPVIAAFSAGITLGGATTTQMLVTGWDADHWETVGSAEYLMVEFALALETTWTDSMTA